MPADSDPAHYQSTKTLFDEHRVVHPSNAFTYALHPEKVTLPKDPADATKIRLAHPFLGTTFTGFSDTPTAIYEGKSYPSFNCGRDTFLYDQELLVEEVPLFLLATRGADGEAQSLGAPPIAGVGPLLSGRPAQQVRRVAVQGVLPIHLGVRAGDRRRVRSGGVSGCRGVDRGEERRCRDASQSPALQRPRRPERLPRGDRHGGRDPRLLRLGGVSRQLSVVGLAGPRRGTARPGGAEADGRDRRGTYDRNQGPGEPGTVRCA